jgi:hypothetical protein
MQVKAFLAQAEKCQTQEDVDNLMEALQQHFCKSSALAHLPQYNVEAYMCGDAPFLRVELKQVISGYFVTQIRPDIRDGKLVVDVETLNMLDGQGVSGQSWNTVEGLKRNLEAEDHDFLDELSHVAREMAQANHETLLERVGVDYWDARNIADKKW